MVAFTILAISGFSEAAETEISINPSNISVSPGEEFSFTVDCSPIQPVKSYELKLSFDSNFIQIDSVGNGSFFDGYSQFFNDGTIDNDAGTVTGIYNLIVGPGNVNSEGSLIEVTASAHSHFGSVAIELYDVGLTNETNYIPITTDDCTIEIQDFISIFDPNPINESSEVDNNLGSLSITINQMSGTLFNYSISTNPDVGSHSATLQSNGTKTCDLSGLEYDTTYEWIVSVQEVESGNWMNRSFVFTTESFTVEDVLLFSNVNPLNQSSSVSKEMSSLSVNIDHSLGGLFNYNIVTSPDVGSSSEVLQSNGSKTCAVSGLTYDSTIQWIVSVQDVDTGDWVNKSFWFTVESEPNDDGGSPGGSPGGDSPGGGGFFPPPPVEDVNNAPYKPVKPSGPVYIEPGGSFVYTGQTFDPDGDLIRYRFNWDDGNVSDWTDFMSGNQTVSVEKTWYQIDNFSVRILAQDEEGLNSSWSDGLLVFCSFGEEEDDSAEKKDPVAVFSSSVNESDGLSCSFNGSNSYDEDGNITSYFWDFGDGVTSTEVNPDHQYSQPGWYNVTLMVTDDEGNVYSKTMSVYVASSVDETDSVDEGSTGSSFPWLFVFIGLGGVFVVVFLLRKQIFSLFFDGEEREITSMADDYEGTGATFFDLVRSVEQKLNPFHSEFGRQRDDPIGLHANGNDELAVEPIVKHQESESMDDDGKDIDVIRRRVDARLTKDDEDES